MFVSLILYSTHAGSESSSPTIDTLEEACLIYSLQIKKCVSSIIFVSIAVANSQNIVIHDWLMAKHYKTLLNFQEQL
jgi:hypothetical protein